MGALGAPRDGSEDPLRDDPVAAAADDHGAVEGSAQAGELGVRDRADARAGFRGLDLEREPVATEPVPPLEGHLARTLGPRHAEPGQRIGRQPREPVAGLVVAAQEARQPLRPRPIERPLQRVRKGGPDLLGRGGGRDLVLVQVRQLGVAQAASTTTVEPWPPPMQAEANPSRAPRRFIS